MRLFSKLIFSFLFTLQVNSQKLPDTIVIQNVIPMNINTILKNGDVFISNKKIINISLTGKEFIKSNYTIIKGSNKYLLPGFSEMLFHNQNNLINEFKLLIASGIKTVRNLAKTLEIATQYFTTDPYLMKNNFKNLDDVKKVVLQHKKRGYDFLKLADNLPKKIYLTLLKASYLFVDWIIYFLISAYLYWSLQV